MPSVAVPPFANMSGDKENEYFSDGRAEEILNLLARIPGLKVIHSGTERSNRIFPPLSPGLSPSFENGGGTKTLKPSWNFDKFASSTSLKRGFGLTS